MSSILNGVRWTEMLLTDEELAVVKAMRNKTDGCLKCEGVSDIDNGNFSMGITDNHLIVYRDYQTITVQISYCPFCGSKLDTKKSN